MVDLDFDFERVVAVASAVLSERAAIAGFEVGKNGGDFGVASVCVGVDKGFDSWVRGVHALFVSRLDSRVK